MASKLTPPDPNISRRLRLRDLLIFSSVAESGSMAKAASEMGITQPSVSEAIAGLEQLMGCRCSIAARKACSSLPTATL